MRSIRSRAREVRGAVPDVRRRHVAADVEELVDRLARPVGVAQLLLGQQQHAAALPPAFAEELVSLEEGRDAEDRQTHLPPGLKAKLRTAAASSSNASNAIISFIIPKSR